MPVCPSLLARMSDNYSTHAGGVTPQADTRPYNIFVRWRRPFCLNEQALSVTRKQRYLEQDCLHWVQKRRAAMGDLSSPTARGFHRYTSREYEKFEGVLSLDWVQSLLQEQDTSSVMTAGAMVSEDSLLPKDHMFTAFLKVGLVLDMICLFSAEKQNFHTIVTLGKNVCGHPKIVHGGLTSAIIDETLGGLNYVLKREGVVGSGPSFTVHLEVDYKKPIPSESTVICTAGLTSIEGKKAWVHAEVRDRPDGELFATGKALFVIPKATTPLSKENGLEESMAKLQAKNAQTEHIVDQTENKGVKS